MSTNRRHFTKHGFHTNNSGKEWFAKLAATQREICNLVFQLDAQFLY